MLVKINKSSELVDTSSSRSSRSNRSSRSSRAQAAQAAPAAPAVPASPAAPAALASRRFARRAPDAAGQDGVWGGRWRAPSLAAQRSRALPLCFGFHAPWALKLEYKSSPRCLAKHAVRAGRRPSRSVMAV